MLEFNWSPSLVATAFVAFAVLPHAQAQTVDSGLKTLWTIGEVDRKNADFALATQGYEAFKDDGFYAIGRSDSKRDWPFIQPGPSDNWAGSKAHSSRIVFGLKSAPTGESRLVVHVLDTQGSTPPRLRATINGFSHEIQLPRGGGDASLEGRFEGSKPYTWSIPILADQLKAGENKIFISSVAGSWLLYDAVSLEVPDGTESEEVNPVQVEAVESKLALIRDSRGKLRQPVVARVHNFGAPVVATLRVGKEVSRVNVPTGAGEFGISVPEVAKELVANATLEVGGKTLAKSSVTLRPVRHWTIYLIAHSHVDIGYTEPQEQVRAKQIANFREGLDLIKKTAKYPADAQFKWNLEVLWPMQQYMRDATPAQRQELLDAVKSGKLVLNAYYGNLLTGYTSGEELLRATAPTLRITDEAGIVMDTAMQTDTPGYTWGNVTAMAQAGVKYFSMGPNASDRIGRSLIEWHDKPFYWQSSSGKDKVLSWMTAGGYSLGHNLGKKLLPFIPGYLKGLEDAKYPYDLACLRWCVNGDNGSPDENLSDTVRDWNAKHAFPRLVIATSRQPFVDLEKKYAKQIPTFKGDFTPFWEDGVASTAYESALKRRATDRLTQAQTMWAMQNRTGYPALDFRTAWEDATLYSEHTWGAYNSVSQPDVDFVKTQWAYKRDFALRADAESKRLLAAAAGAGDGFDIYNTESWNRTDLVILSAEQSRAGDRVIDSAGQAVPSQRLTDGTLAVLIRKLAPLSATRIQVVEGKAETVGTAKVGVNSLSNSALRVAINPANGSISELTMRGIEGNLVDSKTTAVNDYWYLPGGDVKDVLRSSTSAVIVEDGGPLVATLRIESKAPGTKKLTRRVRVVSDIPRVDLINVVDKEAIRAKEGVHFGFGFNIPNPTTRLDMPLAVTRPEVDQLKAANRNWYPVQHWVDISNENYGVTWSTVDAPLVEVGGLTAHMPGWTDQTDPRWIQKTESSATIYSWAMNNHWHTNYKADQEGPVTFQYAITPHSAVSAETTAQLGRSINRPLLALPAGDADLSQPVLQIASPRTTLLEFKPSDDGKAWIVRLWGASGKDDKTKLTLRGKPVTTAYLTNSVEKEGAQVGPIFSVPGYGVLGLRIPKE